MAAKGLTAWRVWSAVPDGEEAQQAWVPGQLYAPLTGRTEPWRGGWAKAVCLPTDVRDRRPHRSPGVHCYCGIHGDRDIEALLAYGSRLPNFARWSDQRHVIGEVELHGRTAPRRSDDTPTTLRAERARIGRVVYFPMPLWPLVRDFERLHPWSRAVQVLTLRHVLAVGRAA